MGHLDSCEIGQAPIAKVRDAWLSESPTPSPPDQVFSP
jgi:hypothetical protein